MLLTRCESHASWRGVQPSMDRSVQTRATSGKAASSSGRTNHFQASSCANRGSSHNTLSSISTFNSISKRNPSLNPQPSAPSSPSLSHHARHHRISLPRPPASSSSAALNLPFPSDDSAPLPAQHTASSTTPTSPADEATPTRTPMPTADIPRPSIWRVPSLTQPVSWSLMLSYLLFMLIMPITALLSKAAAIPFSTFIARATEPVSLHAYYVTFSMALCAAAVNAVFGFLLAWVLVKYDFPGRKWLDAAVDLPFALPTSVAGLTLATVYAEDSFIGQFLASCGIHVVFTRLGVAIAMVFVSFPFVVRTMQPVLQEMEKEMEEAAWSLGATPWETFTKVLFPPLFPSLLTGTALAFSRALGEFGSIVIVSSNFAFKDLIAPVLIFQCLEQYDFVGATVIGTVLLLASLTIMLGVNQLQNYNQRFKR